VTPLGGLWLLWSMALMVLFIMWVVRRLFAIWIWRG
jgi:hypothetical protein